MMTDKSIADRIKDAQAYLWAVGVIALAATTYTGMSRDIQAAEAQYKRVDEKLEKFVAEQRAAREKLETRQEKIREDVNDIKLNLRLLLERTRPKQ